MRISGLIKNSFVDYPEELAIVIFTPYCNMNCFYCHNRELIENPKVFIEESKVFDFLKKRKNMIDAVVITGGEPTLQPDLEQFIKRVKELGYLVKLDSNGFNKEIIEDLLNKKLLDFVAIDYKAPQNKYKEICKVEGSNTLKTIQMLKKYKIKFQVRTTLCPTLTKEDLNIMKKELGYISNYVINKYRIPEIYNKEDFDRINQKPLDIDNI